VKLHHKAIHKAKAKKETNDPNTDITKLLDGHEKRFPDPNNA